MAKLQNEIIIKLDREQFSKFELLSKRLKLVEEKFTTSNNQMDVIQIDAIVKRILLVQSKLVGHLHVDELKKAFEKINALAAQ